MSSASRSRSTVAVVGLGNIGAAIAGALCVADQHDVIACARRAIDRLTLERAGTTVTVPLRTLTDPANADPVDWVLLCCKAHHTPAVADWLGRLCSPATRVAVLQNGIDHVARVQPLVGGAAVLPLIVYYNGERLAPDHVRLRGVAMHELVSADTADGEAFARLLNGSGLRLLLSAEFATLAWRKLLINIVLNPITTLTLQRQGVVRRPDVHALALAVLAEAIAVGRADGVPFAPDEAERTMATLLGFGPELGTSMYFDRLAGRTLEVEALTGAVVAAGERLGIPTPLNQALLTLLRAVSDAATAG